MKVLGRYFDFGTFPCLATIILILIGILYLTLNQPIQLHKESHHLHTDRHSPLVWQPPDPLGQQTERARKLGHSRDFWRVSDDVLTTGLLGTANLTALDADDPRLVEWVREELLVSSASGGGSSYNLTSPDKTYFSQYGQEKVVHRFTKGLRGGFFVESGAFDGETFANTLYLERASGWTGLLVEPDPVNFVKVLGKGRHAYSINVGLSTSAHPQILTFTSHKAAGGIASYWSDRKNELFDTKVMHGVQPGVSYRQVCLPLYTLLLAINVRRIDYFSLDVEGPELDILANVPFDKIDIRLLGIEFGVWDGDHTDGERSRAKLQRTREFFHGIPGYQEIHKNLGDVFFMKTT